MFNVGETIRHKDWKADRIQVTKLMGHGILGKFLDETRKDKPYYVPASLIQRWEREVENDA